jgi:ABC-type polysaccharide/polyol phosphate transport system ATPase subunit
VVIHAEAISKRYPTRPVTMFPPVRSIFERGKTDLRTPSFMGEDYELDEEDDEADGADEAGPSPAPPARASPEETFWALREVSLQVARGAATGIVGPPEAGKSTLLRILAGRAFPTEGRVLVYGRIAPLVADVERALGLSAKAAGHDIVLAARLLGIDARITKPYRDEIEALAQPLLTPDGDPAPGARSRLAVAATVVLPSDAILIDDLRRLDDAFVALVADRLRERLRAGTALVLASRDASMVRQLCDDMVVLGDGTIAGRGDPAQWAADHADALNGERSKDAAVAARAPSLSVSEPETPPRPRDVAAFNASAALISAEVQTAGRVRGKRFDARDELNVAIRLETAQPNAEVRLGVSFTPRTGETGFRLELPQPLRIPRPQAHVLVARVLPATLPDGAYDVRADASVASASARATLIARNAGRIRIEGGDSDFSAPADPPVECRDGTAAWRVEAEWSIKQERLRR